MKETSNVGVMLTPEQKREFHTRCVEYETTMSTVIREAIEKWKTDHPIKTVRHVKPGMFE